MPDDSQLPLFRDEAVREAWNRHGNPVRPLGVATWLATGFLTLALATAIIFVCTVQFADKETVEGELEPPSGAMNVASLKSGTISKLWVHEGDAVGPGQPLITISVDSPVDGGTSLGQLLTTATTTEVSKLQNQLAAHLQLVRLQEDDVAVRRSGYRQQLVAISAEIAAQEKRREIASESAAAAQTLYDRQLMSAVDYRGRQDALLSAAQNLASLQHDRGGLEESLSDLNVESQRVRAQGADDESQIEYTKAQIMERQAAAMAQRDFVVTSQRSGHVADLTAKIGETVVQGQPLAILVPELSKLQAALWIPSRSVGFLKTGDDVALMYDAFPYQRFGTAKGHVTQVANAPVKPQDLPFQLANDAKDDLYKVEVGLDRQSVDAYAKTWPLLPGMHLSADIVLRRETLLEWLFEPLFAARARGQE